MPLPRSVRTAQAWPAGEATLLDFLRAFGLEAGAAPQQQAWFGGRFHARMLPGRRTQGADDLQ